MHKLKEKFKEELYEYEEKAERNPNTKASQQELERIHLLSDSIKNFDKIEMLEEGGGYSEESYYMGEGRLYGTSYDDGSSYARGRGRNAKRDRMGRYSSDGMSYDDMSYDDNSYARGGNRGGQGGNRGGRGMSNRGYSRDDATDQLMHKARKMMDEAESEQERRTIRQFMQMLEDED